MIQRVQSLYLFLAAVAMAAMMFIPSMLYIAPLGEFALRAPGYSFAPHGAGETVMLSQTVMLRVAVFMSVILPLLLIFVYKNREAQHKLCYAEIALVAAAQIMVVYYGFFAYGEVIADPSIGRTFGMGLVMPVVALIFTALAMRGIKKDIKLVKSLDRIR